MYRVGSLPENTPPPATQGAYDPARQPCYSSRSDRLDAEALEAPVASLSDFSEEGFVRVGVNRHLSPEEGVPSVTIPEPIKRMNSDKRRPHRAQPTRRACNAR